MNIEYQDKIDNYLLNLMSTDERQKFEQEVEANEELKEQLEFSRLVQVVLKDRGEKLAKIAKWEHEELSRSCDEDNEQSVSAAPARSWRKYLYWSSGIAAVFIAGFFLLNTMNHSRGDSNLSSIEDANLTISYRGSSANDSKIIEMLAKGDYHSALALIETEEIDVRHKLESLQQVQGNGEIPDAEDLEDEKEIIESELDKLLWLKAQTLIRLDCENEALLILGNLRLKKGDYQFRADSLYQKLKRR